MFSVHLYEKKLKEKEGLDVIKKRYIDESTKRKGKLAPANYLNTRAPAILCFTEIT